MKEAFKDFGTIVHCDVPMDERGRSKGFGVVSFEERAQAEEAIQVMDQAKFNDRMVTVRFDNKYGNY